jgi:hypothetical protein
MHGHTNIKKNIKYYKIVLFNGTSARIGPWPLDCFASRRSSPLLASFLLHGVTFRRISDLLQGFS